ncbi:MAG: molybdopterin cofactor-binding domain-containing protein [Litorimonas sp.]
MTKAEETKTKVKKEKKKGRWTRRGFIGAGLVAGGALVVGVAIRPGDRTDKLAKYVTGEGEHLLTAWVKVAEDNTITAIIPHGEMGQGIHTALSAMLAEEMDADWSALKIMEAPAEKDYANFPLVREFATGGAKVPGFVFDTLNGAMLGLAKSMDMQITGGSTSVRFTGVGAMQTAGAATRELLVKAAAKDWGVPAAELTTAKSMIMHKASNRSAPYGQFAAAASEMKPNLHPTLKSRKDYTLMGQSLPRVDIPSKVNGTAEFGIDAQVDGMKYATVMAAPVHGQSVARMDASSAKAMPGVISVHNMGDYVGVVADGYWQAKQALDSLDVEFTTSAASSLSQEQLFAQYANSLDTGKRKTMHKAGNVAKGAEGAAGIVEAEYQVPYLAHACMEPMNATAWIRDGKGDVWCGTQNPLGTRSAIAGHLDTDIENVTLHTAFMGGGFGRRATPDVVLQAVDLSKASGHPVKLIWSREETTQQDHYRPAVIGRFKAAVDADGMPLTWESVFNHEGEPKEASDISYGIPNKLVQVVDSPSHTRLGPWRSVDHTQHGYFTESFIEELAHAAGKDGYEYRRALLSEKPRFLKVLDAAAKLGNWDTPLPEGQARGISIVESFMTICAQVVTVDMTDGDPKVLHVACAADPGFAVNPDGFEAQMQSGIIYGLTAALYGEITLEDGAVAQSNFHDYEMLRMDQSPKIDTVILTSDARIGGGGEPGTPPIAPALANAVFNATGRRVTHLPIRGLGAAS